MAELEAAGLPVVVIIDSAEDGRRDKMAAAFEGLANVHLAYNTGQRVILSDSANNELTALEPSLVTLRHFRDLPIKPDHETTITVYFGGNGGNDNAAPPTALYRIWRPVGSGSGYLTTSEAKELLVFATAIKTKQEDLRLPNFLRDPRVISLLPALSILCQGYLAAHSLQQADSSINRAAEHMGLPAFLSSGGEDVALLKRVLPLKRAETSSTVWWRKVLGDSRKCVETQIVTEMGVKSIDSTLPLKALIENIYESTLGQLQPSVVADAYCAIAAKLTGKPCET
jgi:hypothetical protein